jgi:replicative DNA helicase
MQTLPAPERFNTAQRYLQIQKSSAELLKAAIGKQLIVVAAGAQLRREGGEKGKETTPSMESIRESGDIEQNAHNVVILNKDYAEVVKAREGYESSQKMAVNTVKQFVFWETNGECKSTRDDNKARLIEKKGKSYMTILCQQNQTQRIHSNN